MSGFLTRGWMTSHSRPENRSLHQGRSAFPVHDDLKIVYTKEAYQQAVDWAQHYYPAEFNLVPVTSLITRTGVSPIQDLDLGDVETIIVERYLHPPYQVNQGGHTSFQRGMENKASEEMTRRLEELRTQYPRLGRYVKFHCHPFIGSGRFLSGGDISCNLVGEPLREWQEHTSMLFVPMQVIWPVEEGKWTITTFLYINGRVHVTPRPIIMKDSDSRFERAVYGAAFWNKEWCTKAESELKRFYEEVSTRDIGRGFLLLMVKHRGKYMAVALPPDPGESMEIYHVQTTAEGKPGRPRMLMKRNFEGIPQDITPFVKGLFRH